MENVFSDEGLIKYGNVVVRFYCTGIVKMAIFKEVYDKERDRWNHCQDPQGARQARNRDQSVISGKPGMRCRFCLR